MQILATSWSSNGCDSIGHLSFASTIILHLLQILQQGGVRAEMMAGTNCHSVDKVVRLGSKEVEQLVEIDMMEVREVLTKVEALATTILDQNGMYLSPTGCEIRQERSSLAKALILDHRPKCLRTGDRWWKGGCDLGGNKFVVGNCNEVEEWVKGKGFTWEVGKEGECLEVRGGVVSTGCTSSCVYGCLPGSAFRRLRAKARGVTGD
jgi:hypothetical protein